MSSENSENNNISIIKEHIEIPNYDINNFYLFCLEFNTKPVYEWSDLELKEIIELFKQQN